MKKRDTQWRAANQNEMTTQDRAQHLLDGWHAAEKDEPLEWTKHQLWIDGYRLRMVVKAALRAPANH